MIGFVVTIFVPIFIIFIICECLLAPKRYNLADSLSSLTTVILMEVLFHSYRLALPLVPYTYIYENWRLVDAAPVDSPLYLLFALVLVDFSYYWGHRFSHSSSLIWSGHAVHHSSEFYNFSTALRQGTFEKLFTFPRFFPLALLGLPPVYMMVLNEIDTVLMFFVHTETIDRLWWPIEYVFVTPSHHRVHHARNEPYLDKNYGGALIIWDRMFGTFVEESEQPIYGLVHPLKTFDPLFVQFNQLHKCVSLALELARDESVVVGVQSLVFGPGWCYERGAKRWRQHDIPPVHAATPKEFLVSVDRRLKAYLIGQFIATASLGYMHVIFWAKLTSWQATLCTALLLHAFVSISELSMLNVDREAIDDWFFGWRSSALSAKESISTRVLRIELVKFGVVVVGVSMASLPIELNIFVYVTSALSLGYVTFL